MEDVEDGSENWNLRANKNKIMKRKILFYDENIINGKQASKQAVAAASAKKENFSLNVY